MPHLGFRPSPSLHGLGTGCRTMPLSLGTYVREWCVWFQCTCIFCSCAEGLSQLGSKAQPQLCVCSLPGPRGAPTGHCHSKWARHACACIVSCPPQFSRLAFFLSDLLAQVVPWLPSTHFFAAMFQRGAGPTHTPGCAPEVEFQNDVEDMFAENVISGARANMSSTSF